MDRLRRSFAGRPRPRFAGATLQTRPSIKEFYRGNLSLADKRMVKGSRMARAMDELSKSETILEQSLPPELRPILKRLTDARFTVNAITAEAYYVDGFRSGAKFTL